MAGVGADPGLAAWVASARDNWICRGLRILNMAGNVREVYGPRTKGVCGGKEGKPGQGAQKSFGEAIRSRDLS